MHTWTVCEQRDGGQAERCPPYLLYGLYRGWISMLWEKIQYVTTGLTLIAFLVSVIAWTYKSKSEERERLIKTAPDDKRGDLVQSALEFFNINTSGLTKADQYKLALVQIHARAQRFRITAIVVCILAVILATVSAYAISKTSAKENKNPEGQPNENKEQKVSLKERLFYSRGLSKISLSAPTEWNYPNDVIRLQGTIVTNGKELSIRAAKLIAEDARIIPSEQPLIGAGGQNGGDGTNGRSGTGAGEAGARGMDGANGGKGEAGIVSGPVSIVSEVFEGRLNIVTSGGAGGNGGRGGNGGNGGDGAQGEASQPGVIDCASGPGWGGRGGDGGAAGKGGYGGLGGSAGTISIQVNKSFTGSFEAVAKGGAGGQPGEAGTSGKGGAGALEGEARGLCQPAGRSGANGTAGALSGSGSQGQNGTDGRIFVKLPKVITEAVGEYQYESR